MQIIASSEAEGNQESGFLKVFQEMKQLLTANGILKNMRTENWPLIYQCVNHCQFHLN